MDIEEGMTPEDVACIKTTLALVIIKQRLQPNTSSCSPMDTDWLGDPSPSQSFVPPGEGLAHLDHMMQLTTTSTTPAQRRGLAMHLACQITQAPDTEWMLHALDHHTEILFDILHARPVEMAQVLLPVLVRKIAEYMGSNNTSTEVPVVAWVRLLRDSLSVDYQDWVLQELAQYSCPCSLWDLQSCSHEKVLVRHCLSKLM